MQRYMFEHEIGLAELELAKTSTLRVTLVPHSGGSTVVSLRVWKDEGPSGYAGPTKQGLLLNRDSLEGVIVALKRAQKTLFEEGEAS